MPRRQDRSSQRRWRFSIMCFLKAYMITVSFNELNIDTPKTQQMPRMQDRSSQRRFYNVFFKSLYDYCVLWWTYHRHSEDDHEGKGGKTDDHNGDGPLGQGLLLLLLLQGRGFKLAQHCNKKIYILYSMKTCPNFMSYSLYIYWQDLLDLLYDIELLFCYISFILFECIK